jgi:hypothetical protein
MHSRDHKSKAIEHKTSPAFRIPARAHAGPGHEGRSILRLERVIGNQAVKRLLEPEPRRKGDLLAEWAPVAQQRTHDPRLQRAPSAAAEGAAQTGEASPGWEMAYHTRGEGLRMNPAFWEVTYYLRADPGTMAFTAGEGRTAFENEERFRRQNRSWRANAVIERIEVALRAADGVTASAAARDLVDPASAGLYGFECYTAAALTQFVGAWRGLQQTSPATADATFDQTYGDFRLTHVEPEPVLTMGGIQIGTNLQLGPFSLRALLDDPSDCGLERGDWVFLNNRRFITRGAFQGENATYLGNKRFYGHGIGVFSIDEYIERLRDRHHVRLSRDEILDQVTVDPHYRAPGPSASESTGSTATP